MPDFVASNNLKPFISNGFTVPQILYQPAGGGQVTLGYEGSILPDVCLVYLAARRAGKLHKPQEHIAEACEIILGALARTGIAALIDEATGFQADRGRDALQRLFNRYLRESFEPFPCHFSEIATSAETPPSGFFRPLGRVVTKNERPSVAAEQYISDLSTGRSRARAVPVSAATA